MKGANFSCGTYCSLQQNIAQKWPDEHFSPKPNSTDWIWALTYNHNSNIWGPSQCVGRALCCFLHEVRPNFRCRFWLPERGWNFDIMLDRLALVSVPNCLYFCSHKMPVIRTDRRLACWRYVETGHVSYSCLEKRAFGLPAVGDQNHPLADTISSASPVMCLPVTQTGADNPSIGSCHTFLTKQMTSAITDKEKEE